MWLRTTMWPLLLAALLLLEGAESAWQRPSTWWVPSAQAPGRRLLSAPNATATLSPSPAPSNSSNSTAPPPAWALVLEMQLNGTSITPWTRVKSYVVSKALRDKYFQASNLSDFTVRLLKSYNIVDDPASDPESSEQAQQIAAAVGEVPWRRRQLEYRRMLLAAAKEKSGVVLQVTVQTTLVRAQLGMRQVMAAAANGTLSDAITATGVPNDSVELVADPTIIDLAALAEASKAQGVKLDWWAIALIAVGGLLLACIPLYVMIRVSNKRRRVAAALEQARTDAAVARAQRRIGKARSFTLHRLSRSSSTGSPSILVGGALGGASLRRSKRSAVQALAAQQQAEDAAGKAGKVGTGKPPLNKKGVLEISIFAGSAPQAGGRALKAKDSELFEAAEGLAVSKLPS